MRLGFVLPIPGFVMKPFTSLVIAAVHIYLAFGHLSQLFDGEVQWTHIWKGFGGLGGAYVFAALALRGLGLNTKVEVRSGPVQDSAPAGD